MTPSFSIQKKTALLSDLIYSFTRLLTVIFPKWTCNITYCFCYSLVLIIWTGLILYIFSIGIINETIVNNTTNKELI